MRRKQWIRRARRCLRKWHESESRTGDTGWRRFRAEAIIKVGRWDVKRRRLLGWSQGSTTLEREVDPGGEVDQEAERWGVEVWKCQRMSTEQENIKRNRGLSPYPVNADMSTFVRTKITGDPSTP